MSTATQPTERDRRLHATVCAQPTDGLSWLDPCGCGHVRGRHKPAQHAPIDVGRGMACSGRNHAGGCHNCPCEQFEAAPRLEEAA